MKPKMRKLLIGIIIVTLLLASFVFFRSISYTVTKEQQANYRISVISSHDYTKEGQAILENIAIGFETPQEGLVEEMIVKPDISLGDDGMIYLAGVNTGLSLSDIGATDVTTVRTTTVSDPEDPNNPEAEKYWAISASKDAYVTSVKAKSADKWGEYRQQVVGKNGNKLSIAGVTTDIDYDDKYLEYNVETYEETDPDTGVKTTYYELINNDQSDKIQTDVELKGYTEEMPASLGYGAPIQMIGDSLLSSDNLLLSKFTALTEYLESAQDYKFDNEYGDGSKTNGDEHFANKYYLKNYNDVDLYVKLNVKITNSKNGAANAARLMLSYFDKETGKYKYDVFALPNADGGKEYVAITYEEPHKYLKNINYINNLVEFDNDAQVYKVKNIEEKLTDNADEAWECINLEKNGEFGYEYYEYTSDVFVIKAGDYIKYTLSAWFEASDPEHTDSNENGKISILGGSMSFEIQYILVDKE